MKKFIYSAIFIISFFVLSSCDSSPSIDSEIINIDPENVANQFDNIPIGMNLNFYIDADKTTKAATPLAVALRKMGVKYLRYPGGDKADEYLFSSPPYDKALPRPARTGKGRSVMRSSFLNEDKTDFKFSPMDFDEFMTICHTTESEPDRKSTRLNSSH